MLDSVGIQKIEEKNKQFLVEKIIHGIEFESMYKLEPERKPEIMETIESNYRIARRVYQQLYLDVSELFAEFLRSLSSYKLEEINNDIRFNGWGVRKVQEVEDSQELLRIFQDFYTLMGRLPLSNELLVIPDGDAPPGENKVNIKQLYELFKNTKSHGLVSLPFLGLIQFYLEKDDRLIKNSLTELYGNLSYMTLSGARDFQFEAVSDLTAKLSFLLKQATINNTRVRELEHLATAKLINDERNFKPTIQGELDELLEILDEPDIEHKKSMFPYEPPQLQTADEIETSSQLVDADFINLQAEFDKVNDMTTEQKQQKRLEDTVEAVINEKNPFTNIGNDF